MSKENIQKAFEVIMEDPRFVSLIKEAGLEVNEKLSDEELDKVAGGLNGDRLSKLGIESREAFGEPSRELLDRFNELMNARYAVSAIEDENESLRKVITDVQDMLAKINEAQSKAARSIPFS